MIAEWPYTTTRLLLAARLGYRMGDPNHTLRVRGQTHYLEHCTSCFIHLAQDIGKRLFLLLVNLEDELNTFLSLTDLGLDSLVGIELRAWWKQVFGFDTSVLEMLGIRTLETLEQHA